VAALQGGWAAWKEAGYPVEGTRVTAPTATAAAWAAAGGVAALGEPDALVTILEFSDFQCPYCRQHALQTLPQIREAYVQTGQVRYIFKDFPLPLHGNAQVAAEAARCAGAQGVYWAMHNRLFEDQKEWASQAEADVTETLVRYGQDLGLDGESLRLCLESGQFGELIRVDQWEGQQAGVQGTPSFVINGQFFAGAYAYEAFEEIIEAALAGEP
jgi:protein-disulfide isomerase